MLPRQHQVRETAFRLGSADDRPVTTRQVVTTDIGMPVIGGIAQRRVVVQLIEVDRPRTIRLDQRLDAGEHQVLPILSSRTHVHVRAGFGIDWVEAPLRSAGGPALGIVGTPHGKAGIEHLQIDVGHQLHPLQAGQGVDQFGCRGKVLGPRVIPRNQGQAQPHPAALVVQQTQVSQDAFRRHPGVGKVAPLVGLLQVKEKQVHQGQEFGKVVCRTKAAGLNATVQALGAGCP